MNHAFLFAMMVAVGIASEAGADDFDWDSPSGGGFEQPPNWDPFNPFNPSSWGPPGRFDTATFNLGNSTYTTTFGASHTNFQLRIGDDHLTFNLQGNSYTLTGDSFNPSILVGGVTAFDDAILTVTNGTLAGQDISIGDLSGSTGTLTVSGSGSELITGSLLFVGRAGTGTLNISAGGLVEHDPGSNGFVIIGESAGSSGTVNVSGGGWLFPEVLVVGGSGYGVLNITGGGSAILIAPWGESRIAAGGGTGEVTVAGGQWTNDWLIVGSNGSGSLEITAGVVSANLINIGFNSGSNGVVIVNEPQSRLFTGDGEGEAELIVGSLGAGTLEIRNGGVVERNTLGQNDVLINPTGSLIVDGTGSRCFADLNVWANGSLTITNGGAVQATNVIVGVTGQVQGDGSITDWCCVTMEMQNSGLVSPGEGASAGTLTIDGNYSQTTDGDLLIELVSPSSHDHLLVTGATTLGGTLNVALIDGFTPSPGQTFTIITAGDVDGTFAQVNAPKGIEVVYTPTSVILEVADDIATCPADLAPADGDDQVNIDDLLVLLSAWGPCADPNDCPADFAPQPGDDTVNVDDLLVLLGAWGACPR